MEKVLFLYLLLSNICALVWICINHEMLSQKNLQVIRRYLISISVGPFIVIPFWIAMFRSSRIKARGQKLANIGKQISKWIEIDRKTYGDQHIDLYNNIINNYDIMHKEYIRVSKKHINFQETYLKKMAIWLGRNYI